MFQITVLTTSASLINQTTKENYPNLHLYLLPDQLSQNDGSNLTNKTYSYVINTLSTRANIALKHAYLRNIHRGKTSFDLILMGYNLNDMLLSIGMDLDCPAIVVSTYPATDPIMNTVTTELGTIQRAFLAMINVIEHVAFLLTTLFDSGSASYAEGRQNHNYGSNRAVLTYLSPYLHHSEPRIVNIGGIEFDDIDSSNALSMVGIFKFKFIFHIHKTENVNWIGLLYKCTHTYTYLHGSNPIPIIYFCSRFKFILNQGIGVRYSLILEKVLIGASKTFKFSLTHFPIYHRPLFGNGMTLVYPSIT